MQIIHDFLARHQITDTTFAVGVSGGADSLALVLMFKQACPNYKIIALTVDHGLRPSSREEAEYVAKIMKRHKIEHHILTWEEIKPQTGIEEHARDARYKLLCDWCHDNNCAYLAIAHHLYDQAETFLMRLQRGSGLFGLASMNEISIKNGINIIRPLLNTHPDFLKIFLREMHLNWVEDESNTDTKLLRVKIRQFLPLLEQKTGISPERICQTVIDLQSSKKFIEDSVSWVLKNQTHKWGNCAYSLDFNIFCSWHFEMQFYFIREILCLLNGKKYPPEATAIKNLLNLILASSFSNTTLGTCLIIKEDLRLWFILENRTTNLSYSRSDWDNYVKQHPEVRGLKIPHKLKEALLFSNLL